MAVVLCSSNPLKKELSFWDIFSIRISSGTKHQFVYLLYPPDANLIYTAGTASAPHVKIVYKSRRVMICLITVRDTAVNVSEQPVVILM